MDTKTLLIITHAPSANTKTLSNSVLEGAMAMIDTLKNDVPSSDLQNSINIILKSPHNTTAQDVLNADGLLLGTIENLGYMSGITKDFFDRCYYELLDKKQGMAYAIYVRAGYDGTATKNALATINNGLRWNMVQEPLILRGQWSDEFINQVHELGMAMIQGMDMGIF